MTQFASKFQPLYERRAAIIAGEAEPTDNEVEAGKASDSDEEDEEEEAKISEVPDVATDAKGIPGFWLTAFRNHRDISETVTDADEAALKALRDVRLSYIDDKPGFKLHFIFGPNDYFSDTELTKTYYYQVSVSLYGKTQLIRRRLSVTVVTLSTTRRLDTRFSGRRTRT